MSSLLQTAQEPRRIYRRRYTGDLTCYRCRVRYRSASVVKAMLLVAYLNDLARKKKPLTADLREDLHSMIRVSDNDAATAIWMHVGERGLYKLAKPSTAMAA